MQETEIKALVDAQRAFFYSGATLPLDYRVEALRTLEKIIRDHETDIAAALKEDLGKSGPEGYMCETGLVLSEIRYMLRHIRRFAREKTVHTPLTQFAARSRVKPSPYGVTLIMSRGTIPFCLPSIPWWMLWPPAIPLWSSPVPIPLPPAG